jgi:dihydrofolate reductase
MPAQCSVFIATSLDGYIARADGSIDWLSIVDQPGGEYWGYGAFFASVDALIIGRKTYETVLAFPDWSYLAKRCVVLTHRPATPQHGEEFYAGELEPLVRRLGDEGTKRIYVDGGQVIGQFLRAGLIDDLTISLVPILLGGGARLFPEPGVEARLKLVSTQEFPTGLVQVRYELSRAEG